MKSSLYLTLIYYLKPMMRIALRLRSETLNKNVDIPFTCLIYDKDNSPLESWEARISYIKNYGSHYEMRIQFFYGSVLVLFGKTVFGYFACIPDFEAGCYLSYLKDTFWNTKQLTRIIDEVTGITVAKALNAIADYISPKDDKRKRLNNF